MNLDSLVNEYDKKQMLEVEMQSRLGRRICKRVILRDSNLEVNAVLLTLQVEKETSVSFNLRKYLLLRKEKDTTLQTIPRIFLISFKGFN